MFKFSDLFKSKVKAPPPTVQSPSVLICGIGDAPYFEQDKSIYSPYGNITESKVQTLYEFETLINGRTFDIVHLFVNLEGASNDKNQTWISLFQLLTKSDTKLVMFASPNSIEDYMAAFPAKQRKGIDNMHLVLTIDRIGDNFTNSFKSMFELMAQGQSMPMAWVTLAPQHQGPWMDKMPACMFEANRGGLLFLP